MGWAEQQHQGPCPGQRGCAGRREHRRRERQPWRRRPCGRQLRRRGHRQFSIGRVTSDSGGAGGLVCSNLAGGGTARDSYWDTQTSGHSESADGEGKTTSELQSPTGYTGIYENWNLDLDKDGVGDDLWDFGNASQYPTLRLHSELAESG